MLNIAICDNSIYLEDIENSVVSALFNENELNIDLYDLEDELIETVKNSGCSYDMVFLAINSDDSKAFQIAEAIRNNNLQTELLFISDNADCVLHSFVYKPFDYIVKPFTVIKAKEIFERYNFYHNSQNEEYFSFKSGSYSEKIRLNSIHYFYSTGRKIVIVTESKEFEFYSKLDEVEQLLEYNTFIRIHQSYLVNFAYIKYIVHNDLVLENDDYLPISRNRLKEVKEKFMKFIG